MLKYKLIEILKTHSISDAVDCAEAIFSAFPQIEAEKIWEGNIEDVGLDQNLPLLGEVPISWKGIALFMKETTGGDRHEP